MSITIIDHTKPPSPKWVYVPVPDFRKEIEMVRYYHREHQRWWEGHAGLTGKHYFYLQEIWLKDIDGDHIRPNWRDVDELVFNKIEDCESVNEGLLIYKRREVGMSSIFMGGLPFWYMRMYPGTTVNLTAKDKVAYERSFKDKIIIAYEHMSHRIFSGEAVRKNDAQKHYLQLGAKVLNEDGSEEYRTSELNLQETSEKPSSVTKFSASRARYTFIDEAPLHPRREQLLESLEATLRKGTERKGFLAMGGSIEPKLTNEELSQFQKLIENSKHLKLQTLFLPGWMGLEQFAVNGWSDEKRGMDWLEENYARLDLIEDKRPLIAFRKQYPRYESDIFELSRGGEFEEDVTEILKDHLNFLKEKGIKKDKRYTLVPSGDGIVGKPDSEKGKFIIIEHPKDNVQYDIVIDGVATSKETGNEDGSFIAAIVMKRFDPTGDSYVPCGIYFERPDILEQSYRNIVKLFKFYNLYGGMNVIAPESNAGFVDPFVTFLKKEGLLPYIMRRKDLTGSKRTQTNKFGQYRTDDVKVYQLIRANPFLRKFARNIKSQFFLEQLLLPAGVNADIRDAFYMFMISCPNWDVPIKKQTGIEFKTSYSLVKNNKGQMVWESIRVPITKMPNSENTNTEYDDMLLYLKNKYGNNYQEHMDVPESEELQSLAGGLERTPNY